MSFSLAHIASLFRYTGISFTAGAITHGLFSEERSILTAIIGIISYLIGSAIDKLVNPNNSQTWTVVLVIGIVSSIGLGFFTGGLQHFPDSPSRSLWVVPLGFLMSLVGVYFLNETQRVNKKAVITYAVIGTLVTVIASVIAFKVLDPHHHDDGHHGATPSNHSESHSGGHKH